MWTYRATNTSDLCPNLPLCNKYWVIVSVLEDTLVPAVCFSRDLRSDAGTHLGTPQCGWMLDIVFMSFMERWTGTGVFLSASWVLVNNDGSLKWWWDGTWLGLKVWEISNKIISISRAAHCICCKITFQIPINQAPEDAAQKRCRSYITITLFSWTFSPRCNFVRAGLLFTLEQQQRYDKYITTCWEGWNWFAES